MADPKKSKKKRKGKKRRKKTALKNLLRPIGFIVDDKAARKRARLNRPPRYPWELFFIHEPSRYEQEEGNYTEYQKGRAIKVHMVPAPWSRVILLAVLYGFVVGVTKFLWFYNFGKPQWLMATPIEETAQPSDPSG